jgi:hypothetical protein
MPTKADAPPLLDNLEFLGELEQLEPAPKAGQRTRVAAAAARPAASAQHASKAEVRGADGPRFMTPIDDAATDAAATTREMSPVLAVAGFVVMMSIGAGAALLVFHDRVALIAAQWSSLR